MYKEENEERNFIEGKKIYYWHAPDEHDFDDHHIKNSDSNKCDRHNSNSNRCDRHNCNSNECDRHNCNSQCDYDYHCCNHTGATGATGTTGATGVTGTTGATGVTG